MPVNPEPPSSSKTLPRATIQSLHKLIYDISLPKSSVAKQCSVPLETIHAIRHVVSQLVQPPATSSSNDSRLDKLSSKIDALTAKFETNPSYASVVQSSSTASSSSQSPPHTTRKLPTLSSAPRDTSCDLTLCPKDRRSPAFASETCLDILTQFNQHVNSL
jgi:hypothetical protein